MKHPIIHVIVNSAEARKKNGSKGIKTLIFDEKMTHKLLIIEDDADAAQVLKLALSAKGYAIVTAKDGHEGLQQAYESLPDLIILDIMMPGMNGFDVCARLREMMDVPVLMLTAMVSEGDILHGFKVGADDYVRKPYSITELDARIRSLLRRHEQYPTEKQMVHYFDGELEIDFVEQSITYLGRKLRLSPTEIKLLNHLFYREGKLISRSDIILGVWGDGHENSNQLLSMYISRLRRKLKVAGCKHDYIRTYRSQGYAFIALPDRKK